MKTYIFIKNLILDAIFPHKCVCGKIGTVLCDECKSKITFNNTQLCPICKKISENGKTCASCRNKSNLTGVIILAPHKEIIKDAIWNLKYNFISDLAEPLSDILSKKNNKFLKTKQFVITSVPISKKRLKWRGYNQAELLAKELASKCDLKYLSVLSKKDDVMPQVGLSRKDRIINIQGKIVLVKNFDFESQKNNRIIIVDDVYTTGSTLEECARVLRKAGFREVWGIVLSRD